MKKQAKNKSKTNTKLPKIDSLKSWVISDNDCEFVVEKDTVIAFPKKWSKELSLLLSHLNVIHYGVNLASIKGKDFIPTQSLAMSQLLNKTAFEIVDVDYITAISYLRREAIVLEDAPRGYILLTYNEKPLGFVKNLGNRANNLYPHEWRILSSHIPDERPNVLGLTD